MKKQTRISRHAHPRRRVLPRAPLALALTAALGLVPLVGHAATITVTDGGDNGTSTTCTLRQAIESMNNAMVTGTCSASDGFGSNDTIVFDTASFPNDGSGTITLAGSRLHVTAMDLTIDASANTKVTIDAAQSSGVLIDTAATGGRLELDHLSLTNGVVKTDDCKNFKEGGGICIPDADLHLQYSIVSGNSADYGGGIYSQGGRVTLTHSTVSGNTAYASGGGIYSMGSSLTLTNSTVSGNSADNSGGGIHSPAGSAVTLTNSTISGNSADNSGSGIYISAVPLTAWNSIIAGNTGSTSDVHGATPSGGHNLIGDTMDPMLGPLADNGGPTQTMLPRPGSPAIDRGDSAHCPATDQRGVLRPQGSHCDIGAVERANPDWLFSNGSKYTRYGQMRTWVLQLSNPLDTAITGLSLEGQPPAAVDTAGMSWQCVSPPPAQCTVYGTGPLLDTSVSLPAHSDVLWIVTAPVKPDATADTLDMRVHVSNAPGQDFDAIDTDTLVLFRDGFDVVHADGTMAVPMP